MTSRKALIQILENSYPNIRLATAEEFYSSPDEGEGGIWVRSTEDGLVCDNELPMFHYYAMYESTNMFDGGVNVELVKILSKHGWYVEWNDPGTAMIYPE